MTSMEKAEQLTIWFALLSKDFSSAKASAIMVCNEVLSVAHKNSLEETIIYYMKVKMEIEEL